VGAVKSKLDDRFSFPGPDSDDPSVGLINGELAIPGNLLRREVFDPVVNQVRKTACPRGRLRKTDHTRARYWS
jgi:hypothetical protein